MMKSYGNKVKVSFSKTEMETNACGRKFWFVEGEATVRRSLFRKKTWHFVYYVDADLGRISMMRGRKISNN